MVANNEKLIVENINKPSSDAELTRIPGMARPFTTTGDSKPDLRPNKMAILLPNRMQETVDLGIEGRNF